MRGQEKKREKENKTRGDLHKLIMTMCYELSMNLKRERSFSCWSFLCCSIISGAKASVFGKTCCPRGNMAFKGFFRAVYGGFLR